jgi:hypothetical protein
MCVSLRDRLPPVLSAGPKHHFERSLHTRTLCDHSDKTIRECYARTEALQGKGTISIDEIRPLLSYVYGGLPPEREVGLLTRHCDLQQRGPQLPGRGAESGILLRVSLDLLMEAVEIVRKQLEENLHFKQIAGVKQVAGEFQSRAHMAEHAHKHARSKFNPSGQRPQHRGGARQQGARGAARCTGGHMLRSELTADGGRLGATSCGCN